MPTHGSHQVASWFIFDVGPKMKPIGVTSTVLALALGMCALCLQAKDFAAGIFFVPFALGPLLISLALAVTWKREKKAQITLALSTGLFSIWFSFVFLDAFYWHPDPQSPIAMVFVGLYSLPVMLTAWVAAWRLKEPASRERIAS